MKKFKALFNDLKVVSSSECPLCQPKCYVESKYTCPYLIDKIENTGVVLCKYDYKEFAKDKRYYAGIGSRETPKDILEKIPDYQLNYTLEKKFANPLYNTKEFINQRIKNLKDRTKLCIYFLHNFKIDVLMVNFQANDILQHSLWGFMQKEHRLYDQKLKLEHRGGSWLVSDAASDFPALSAAEYINEVNIKNNFDGAGLKFGVDNTFVFSDSWSLFANGALSLLYGRFTVHHLEQNILALRPDAKLKVFEATEHLKTFRPVVDLFAGVKWKTYVMEDKLIYCEPGKKYVSQISGDVLTAHVETTLYSSDERIEMSLHWSGKGKIFLLKLLLPLLKSKMIKQSKEELETFKQLIETRGSDFSEQPGKNV